MLEANYTDRHLLRKAKPALAGHTHTPESWFRDCLARSQAGLFSEVVEITPEIARVMLAGNDKNRAITNSHVVRLASDIEDGKWDLNGESIKIAADGRLADGQHRLHAAVLSNKSFRTVVTFGVDYSSRVTTDQGKSKSVGDYLSMEASITNANNAAAAARILLSLRVGTAVDAGTSKSITKTRIRAEYFANRKAIDSAVTFVAGHSTSRVLGGPSTLAAILVLLRRRNANAEDFMEKFIKGSDLSDGDAILAARDRLIREPRMRLGDRITLLTKAFDLWLQGRETKKIIVKSRIAADRNRMAKKKGK